MARPGLLTERWQARRLENVLRGGRTRPLLIDCERTVSSQTERDRFVVKVIGLPEVQDFTLCHEFIGATIAAIVGVRVARIALIDIADEFVQATRGTLAQEELAIRAGLAVGSHYIQGLAPMPKAPVINDGQRSDAAMIYTLDMAIQN